jgi:hypothetical protein
MTDTSELHEIVYVSSACNLWDHETLHSIVEKSRNKNIKNQVTGMLLYCEGGVIQALEGREAEVRATFLRIQQDNRHKDITLLLDRSINQRSFDKWSMGLARCTHAEMAKELDIFDALDQEKLRSHLKNHSGGATKMLQGFARRYRE